MNLRLYSFELPLKHVFTISRGTIQAQTTLIVELEEDGRSGYGEAPTNDYYGESMESMVGALQQVRERIESISWEQPDIFWRTLDPQLQSSRFAQCALDQAAHDLWGKRHDRPVWDLWGLTIDRALPPSNYTIGIDDIDTMIEKMQEYPDWPVYKVKLGTDHDVEIIRRLREHTVARFRVDANCGWDAQSTLEKAAALKELGVEFIEQPLPAGDMDGMAELAGRCPLPLIADEDCITEQDVGDCFHMGYNGINIKLTKCGGLTPARRMIAMARRLGMKVMVGCMTESTVGISAIAQLLPLLDFVDMDGAVLLAEDIATGATLRNGRCVYPDRPGTGVELTREGTEV